jgi:hypothetical protein
MKRRDDEIEHLQTPAGLAPIGAGVLADAAAHSLPVLGPLLSLVRLSAPSPCRTTALHAGWTGLSGVKRRCPTLGHAVLNEGHGDGRPSTWQSLRCRP